MKDTASRIVTPNSPGLTPLKVVQTYTAEEWEEFIDEWVDSIHGNYTTVTRLGGSGDKGRDVVGYVTELSTVPSIWDNYQCKHYDHPLYPTDAYVELGKLCFYTCEGDYPAPRKYYFVAPQDVGVGLFDLLRRPESLRAALIASWGTHCARRISKGVSIPLQGKLLKHVEAFDFSCVNFIPTRRIINDHARTKYHFRRFKMEPPMRPSIEDPPIDVQNHELPYVAELLAAYSDHVKSDIASTSELSGHPNLHKHFRRSRGHFFSAEALARFSRDHFAADAFENVKRYVYDGVADEVLCDHIDGFKCLLAVTKTAASLGLPHSDLLPHVGPGDKIGVCHHLANEGELTWVKK